MLVSYTDAKRKLTPWLRHCRDRDLRAKANLILLACKLQNVTEACDRRGFSRKFFYKWYRRLRRSGFKRSGLEEYSRRPRTKHPLRTKASIEKKVKILRGQGYGSPTIQGHLKREGKRLSCTTICHILRHRKKAGPKTRREKLKAHRRRYEIPIPGWRAQMDVKYVPEKLGELRAYAYVIVDECTRMRFIYAYTAINPSNTVDFLERAQAFFPFSLRTIQTDNGPEFTYRLNPSMDPSVIHPMDEWCAENGIHHRCIPPGEKELNGKVERSHRIDEQCFYWRAPADTEEHLNEEILNWVRTYNQDRLHGGIGFITPYEKLLERFQKLREQRIEGYEDLFQLRFIRELPKRLENYKHRMVEKPPLLSRAA